MQEPYIVKNHKKLRCGYTTGTCAAAAAHAAAYMLLEREPLPTVRIATPKGMDVDVSVRVIEHGQDYAVCATQKDGGDDPDVTTGIWVHARAERVEQPGVRISGGVGVGVVTKPGLACPVGEAAINPVPRRMIEAEVESVMRQCDCGQGIAIEISVPEGVGIAKKTLNSRLGIVGGISILGTSGVVEPMSEAALVDTIKVEMNVAKAAGKRMLVLTPGNYGMQYLRGLGGIPGASIIKCSNYVGDALDHALDLELTGILLVGHAGKFVKLAGGVMNTHSRYADCRMEILAAYAAAEGAQRDVVKSILNEVTVDGALRILHTCGLAETVMHTVLQRMVFHVEERLRYSMWVEAKIFSNEYGMLAKTAGTDEMIKILVNEG